MWREELERMLPLLGHRNWILVVDKAYPLHRGKGITTIDTGEPLTEVLGYLLGKLGASSHLKPVVYTDRELDFMGDDLAEGVSGIRREFDRMIGETRCSIPHDEIFGKLDAASKLFGIVVLKTDSLIPYTSVFIELDCGYWNPAAEKELRERMNYHLAMTIN